MHQAISYLPARPLTPDEHGLVAEWLAVAGDIALAYVSGRRSDDAALYRRVVIVTKADEGPSHLFHTAAGRNVWVVFTLEQRVRIRRSRSLRAALNSIGLVIVYVNALQQSRRPNEPSRRPPTQISRRPSGKINFGVVPAPVPAASTSTVGVSQ